MEAGKGRSRKEGCIVKGLCKIDSGRHASKSSKADQTKNFLIKKKYFIHIDCKVLYFILYHYILS